jgi:hypothetical protein
MSDTQRETKQITVGSHTITVNTFVTGRELRDIESAMLDKLEMKQTGGAQEISGFRGSMLKEREDAQIKAVIVDLDGTAEDLVNRVLNLPAPEYREVMAYVSEITEPKKEQTGN